MSQRIGFRVYRTAPSSLDRGARSSSALCRYKVVKNLVDAGRTPKGAGGKAECDSDVLLHDAVVQEL